MPIPKYFTVKQRDGSVWGVPVDMIARNRAAHYASEFGGDVERSLAEDTLPLFAGEDKYPILDWAVGNMNWSDFDGHHVLLQPAPALTANDFDDAWNGGSDHNADHGYSDHEVQKQDPPARAIPAELKVEELLDFRLRELIDVIDKGDGSPILFAEFETAPPATTPFYLGVAIMVMEGGKRYAKVLSHEMQRAADAQAAEHLNDAPGG